MMHPQLLMHLTYRFISLLHWEICKVLKCALFAFDGPKMKHTPLASTPTEYICANKVCEQLKSIFEFRKYILFLQQTMGDYLRKYFVYLK